MCATPSHFRNFQNGNVPVGDCRRYMRHFTSLYLVSNTQYPFPTWFPRQLSNGCSSLFVIYIYTIYIYMYNIYIQYLYTHFVIYHMFGSIVCFRNQKHAHIFHLFLMSIGKIVQKQPRSRSRILVINTFCSHRSHKNLQCPKRIPIGTLVFPPNNPRHQRVPKCSQHFCDRPHMTTRCHRADGSGAMMDTTGFQMDIGVLTYDTYDTYEYESHW